MGSWFSRERVLAIVEPLLYGHRIPVLILLGAATLFMFGLAFTLQVETGFYRLLPAEHPYLQVLERHRDEFGGADVVLIAVEQKDRSHDLYNARFLARLKRVTEETMALSFVDRARVSSLFTADARTIEPARRGFVGRRIVPAGYKPEAPVFARMRESVEHGGYVGRLVSLDQTAALVIAPLRPAPRGADYRLLGQRLEDRLRHDEDDAIAIRIVGQPALMRALSGVPRALLLGLLSTLLILAVVSMLHLGTVRMAVPVLAGNAAALAWQLGLSALVDVHLDPLALSGLLPALVLAQFHGALFASAWISGISAGQNGYDASLTAFRRMWLPGALTCVAAIAGLFTLQAIPIAHVRELATSAALGVLALPVTHGVLMPVWYSYLKVGNVEAFAVRQRRRAALFRPALDLLAALARPLPGGVAILAAAAFTGAALWQARAPLLEGERRAAPELHGAEAYNLDSSTIDADFPGSARVLRVIAETDADGCTQQDVMDQIDELAWQLENTPGVSAVRSLPGALRDVSAAGAHGNPRFGVLPRSKYALAQAIAPIATASGLLNADCSAMALHVTAADRNAATLTRLMAAVQTFNVDNARRWFAAGNGADPGYCAEKRAARRDWGDARNALRDALAAEPPLAGAELAALRNRVERARARVESKAHACPVNFALASGPLAVNAARSEVLGAQHAWVSLWLCGVLALLMALALRTAPAALCVAGPVLVVSVAVQALMAQQLIAIGAATIAWPALLSMLALAGSLHAVMALEARRREGADPDAAAAEWVRDAARPLLICGAGMPLALAPWLLIDIKFVSDLAAVLMAALALSTAVVLLLCPALYRYLQP